MKTTSTNPSSNGRSRAHSLDPSGCSWAVLQNMPTKAGSQAIAAAAEPFFPLPLERLELRCVRLGTAVVVCAIARERLDTILAGAAAPPKSIHPADIPAEVTETLDTDHTHTLRPDHFEFRTGQYEPKAHRRRRIVALAAMSAAILVASIATAERWRSEAHAMRQNTAMLRLETDAALRSALASIKPRDTSQPPTLEPRLELASWLNQLRRTRSERTNSAIDSGTIVPPWLSLLRAWPAEPRIAVDRLVLTPRRLTIDGRGAGIDDAERLRVALEAFHPGWQRVAYRYTDARENAQPFVFEFEATGEVSPTNRTAPPAVSDRGTPTPRGRTGR